MSCGKKPLRKLWDKPKKLRTVKPSRYEQNEPYVKLHWKNVVKDLEMSYDDARFWENNYRKVRELIDPLTYKRIASIFNLPMDKAKYQSKDLEDEDIVPSEEFHTATAPTENVLRPPFSMTSYESSLREEESIDEEWSVWSTLTLSQSMDALIKSHSKVASKASAAKSLSSGLNKPISKFMSRSTTKSTSGKMTSKLKSASVSSAEESAKSDNDMEVHPRSARGTKHDKSRFMNNPHFDMLFCNDSETDMIKWNSKYKHKTFEISASDEFSKKAELATKKISYEFYDWWVYLGSKEFRSEIKRPKDIEDLFKVWFDEHASRGLVLEPNILPCVLDSIANRIGKPKSSCPNVLVRQIMGDIHAETSPANTMAFGTCLPHNMKHIPPKNNTEDTWHCVKIPEDLRTMETVWGDISHLTSTKSFQKWLKERLCLAMPACFKDPNTPKHRLFAIPSNFMAREKSMDYETELAFPVSQLSIEIKEVLSQLLSH